MKIAVLILSMCFGLSAFALPIADGVYDGQGYFQLGGIKNHYSTSVNITGNKMMVIYKARNVQTVTIDMVPMADGNYSVGLQGIPDRGFGYCIDAKKQCHIDFMAGATHVEETFIQEGDKLTKIGSKSTPAGRISWYEELTLQAPKQQPPQDPNTPADPNAPTPQP